jgi:hypothetical protein
LLGWLVCCKQLEPRSNCAHQGFGGGKTSGFCLIYDNQDIMQKVEPRHRLIRVRAVFVVWALHVFGLVDGTPAHARTLSLSLSLSLSLFYLTRTAGGHEGKEGRGHKQEQKGEEESPEEVPRHREGREEVQFVSAIVAF